MSDKVHRCFYCVGCGIKMEMSKLSLLMLICISMHGFYICGTTSCHQRICNCRDDMIFCIDMAVPSFNYRPSVTRLYLERVQLLELAPIFKALPNLLYLSLVDMQYFSCSWMEDIPQNIVVTTNMCMVSTGLPLTSSSRWY